MLRTEFPLIPRFVPEGMLAVIHEKELHIMKTVASQIAYTVHVTFVESSKTFSAAVLSRVYTRGAQILEKSKSRLKILGPRCDVKHVPY
jgi:hypothetical protein